MADTTFNAQAADEQNFCQSVCIHTKKIYDSCREEDIAPYKILDKIKKVLD